MNWFQMCSMTAVRNDLRSSIMTVSVHVSFTLDDIMTIMFLQSPLCLEVPGNQMGHRGTARNDKSLKSFISGAAPRNPFALPLETPWRCPSKPLRRPSKPHGAVPRNPGCAAPQNPWGQILRPKFSSFGGF